MFGYGNDTKLSFFTKSNIGFIVPYFFGFVQSRG